MAGTARAHLACLSPPLSSSRLSPSFLSSCPRSPPPSSSSSASSRMNSRSLGGNTVPLSPPPGAWLAQP
eukprot:8865888-Pyramimonas_sp.AAC.1